MVLIIHKYGNVQLPKYGLLFLPGKPVEVSDKKLVERILRNSSFKIVEPEFRKKRKEKGVDK